MMMLKGSHWPLIHVFNLARLSIPTTFLTCYINPERLKRASELWEICCFVDAVMVAADRRCPAGQDFVFICVTVTGCSAAVCDAPTGVVARSVQPPSVRVERAHTHAHKRTPPGKLCVPWSCREGVPSRTTEERAEVHCFVSEVFSSGTPPAVDLT